MTIAAFLNHVIANTDSSCCPVPIFLFFFSPLVEQIDWRERDCKKANCLLFYTSVAM